MKCNNYGKKGGQQIIEERRENKSYKKGCKSVEKVGRT
jgi:hypothetical protein